MDIECLSNDENMEEKIKNIIIQNSEKLSYNQIKKLLDIENEEENQKLNEILEKLELEGYLYLNDYGKYQLFSKSGKLSIGEIRYNSKNKPYVVCGKNCIYISPNYLNGAITGDIVIVKKCNHQIHGYSSAVIDKILKRQKGELIFDYINGEFIPYNWTSEIKVNINNNNSIKLVNGSRVLVKFSLEKENNYYNGEIVSIIGHKDDPSLEIKTIAIDNGIDIDFSKEALEQANSIKTYVTEEEIQERLNSDYGRDFRGEIIFTIDGKNTKDIDDAVSIKKLSNGNYLLGVHIADVSHYIKEDSILDLEARERSTSTYPYNYVIPMLPHILSNGICSLNPNEDRLALSCIMEINHNGEVINYEIVDSIINSKMKMRYDEINDIFEKNIMHKQYEPYIYDLSLMAELSIILESAKIKRGFISFNDTEVQFEDNNGIPTKVSKRTRGTAEKIIENFMLLANETVSTYYYNFDFPGIYRDHPAPNADSIRQIVNFLGLNIRIPQNLDNPKAVQNIINKIQKYDEGDVYGELLLRSMKRAFYSPYNIGHFGLALTTYTHFTSPIRRYPDLMTHRILRLLRDNLLDVDYEKLIKKLDSICKHASIKERIADRVEKTANEYKMAEYMENHIGEYFSAYIQCISKKGITIKTKEGIFGKISMEQLQNEGFNFDEKYLCLYNKNTNTQLFIGNNIEVKVTTAQRDKIKIIFSFIKKIEKDNDKGKIKKIS